MGIDGLAEGIADFFFDRLEVVGQHHVPDDRPVIFAANHHSGLIDAILMYAASPRDLRAVGKSTLWDIWPLRPFLDAAEVIPVRRVRDGGGSNADAFAAVSDALVAGGAIVIFVEGTSHDNPGLVQIKTGAARMAFDAMVAGAEPVVVPVGIIFEDRQRFRSDALVRFGSPIDVVADHPRATSDDRDAVRALTDTIETGLRVVAPEWSSEADRAAARSAAIETLPVGATLAAVEAEAERIAAVRPVGGLPVDTTIVGPRGEADLLVDPSEVDPLGAALVAPVAFVGKWANRPPYLAVRAVAARGDLNIRATYKVAAGMVLFPLWWSAIAFVAWFAGVPGLWAILLASAVAVLGIIAAREYPRARAERRTMRRLRRQNSTQDAPD